MKRPPYLQKGSHVRIISTARKISQSEVQPSVNLLNSWGLRVSFGKHTFDQYHQFAGEDQMRAFDLQHALDDPDVDMIWCSRGGYGTVKLIDNIDFSRFIESPKWVVGYSDVTGLLCHITEQLGVASLHATMPVNIKHPSSQDQDVSNNSLRSVLFGEQARYTLPSHRLSKPGSFSGELIGGNLSILYSILGTSSAPRTNGKVLFLEDLDEYLYHIDRMMVNLNRNGLLKDLSGLIVGGMSDMNDNTVPYGLSAEEIVLKHVENYNYPVYFGFDAGHVSPNLALPFGFHAEVENNIVSFSL